MDLFGIVTVFKVDHQSHADKVSDFNLFAICLLDLLLNLLSY